jgi:hypothetical protein
MLSSSVYLTGGTLDSQNVVWQVPDADWRSQAVTKLQRHGLRVVNPLEFTWGNETITEQAILSDGLSLRVRRSLELIDQCDAVLANLNRSSYGAAMEIFYAYRQGKVVTVVGQSPFSPWVLSHSQARFGDMQHALDYIIEEQPQPSQLFWALQNEALLAEHYEQHPPAGEPDYKFLGGKLPVLAVAPHATAHWREGEFQEADAYTGSMASLLNRVAGCHSLISTYCCVADPLWYLETPFRRAFADIVKAGQVGLVLILVGSLWHEAPGLQVLSSPQSEEYANRLRSKLMNIETVSSEYADDRLGVFHRFAQEELGVATIVLKMHKRYRMPKLQPEGFSLLNQALSDFLFEVGTEIARSQS